MWATSGKSEKKKRDNAYMQWADRFWCEELLLKFRMYVDSHVDKVSETKSTTRTRTHIDRDWVLYNKMNETNLYANVNDEQKNDGKIGAEKVIKNLLNQLLLPYACLACIFTHNIYSILHTHTHTHPVSTFCTIAFIVSAYKFFHRNSFNWAPSCKQCLSNAMHQQLNA